MHKIFAMMRRFKFSTFRSNGVSYSYSFCFVSGDGSYNHFNKGSGDNFDTKAEEGFGDGILHGCYFGNGYGDGYSFGSADGNGSTSLRDLGFDDQDVQNFL
jgi:hypothetical protein